MLPDASRHFRATLDVSICIWMLFSMTPSLFYLTQNKLTSMDILRQLNS